MRVAVERWTTRPMAEVWTNARRVALPPLAGQGEIAGDRPGDRIRRGTGPRAPVALPPRRGQGDRELPTVPAPVRADAAPGRPVSRGCRVAAGGEQDVGVEAGAVAGVAGRADLVDHDQQRVAVAVEPDLAHVLDVAGGVALAPVLRRGCGSSRSPGRSSASGAAPRRPSSRPSAPRRCRAAAPTAATSPWGSRLRRAATAGSSEDEESNSHPSSSQAAASCRALQVTPRGAPIGVRTGDQQTAHQQDRHPPAARQQRQVAELADPDEQANLRHHRRPASPSRARRRRRTPPPTSTTTASSSPSPQTSSRPVPGGARVDGRAEPAGEPGEAGRDLAEHCRDDVLDEQQQEGGTATMAAWAMTGSAPADGDTPGG